MKKLNKKGFTLVELLAVIVILAVIMVITIPTVLGSMSGAKKEAFDTAVAAVNKYIADQVELCTFGNNTIAPYEASIFESGTCNVTTSQESNILSGAGYTGKMDITEIKSNKISKATGLGEFAGQSFGK